MDQPGPWLKQQPRFFVSIRGLLAHIPLQMEAAQKILLIDDDPLVAQLIGMLVGGFRGTPYTVDHSADYAGGLQRLLTGSYALCLLDYRLGDSDGLELLRNAKARECPTPIILLTGDTREEIDLAAMEGGAADFICKSDFKPDSFEQAVDYAIKTEAARKLLRANPKRSETGS
jgi:two-component system, cell cycle response regulator